MPASHLSKDQLLKPIIESITLPALTGSTDTYFALLESIVSQQLSVKVADVIFGRFINLFENKYPEPALLLAIDNETLRSVGLSYQKAGYLKNVADFAINRGMEWNKLDSMGDDDLIKYLVQIKGVGKWTVEMLLMFIMKREDVFPVDDLGIQQAMIKLYGLEEKGKPLKAKMIEIAEGWRPYRSVAARYLWKWKDTK